MKEGADMKKHFWGVLQLVIGFAVMLVVGSVMIPPPPVFLPILYLFMVLGARLR
jgi:hypothetical protein